MLKKAMMQFSDLLIEIIADILVIPIVIIGAIAMLRLPRKVRFERCAWGVVAGLTALLLGKVASLLYQGERPFVELGVEPKAAYLSNPGFPSDHVLFVFTIVFVVWISTKNRRLGFLLLILAGLVGLGRILALVHSPIDVVGGIICASLAALVVYKRQFYTLHLPKPKTF